MPVSAIVFLLLISLLLFIVIKLKWQKTVGILFGASALVVTLIISTGLDKTKPENVKFVYNSKLPQGFAIAVTMCDTVHYKDSKEQVKTQQWLIRHELSHVSSCIRKGALTFYFSYQILSYARFLDYGSLQESYFNNQEERDARREQTIPFETWQWEFLKREGLL